MTRLTDTSLTELVSANELRQRVKELAQQINTDFTGREIDLVCLTNSASVFTADLCRMIKVPIRQHLLAFNPYNKPTKSGEVALTLDVTEPLQDRHVLVTEGMVISGRTPLYLMNLLRLRQPASLELCAIGSKPSELAVDLPIKYRLFEFGKEWVAGYGIGNGAEKVFPNLTDMTKST